RGRVLEWSGTRGPASSANRAGRPAANRYDSLGNSRHHVGDRTMSAVRARLGSLFLMATTAAAPADEFRDLFDGTTLDGWVIDGPTKDKEGKPVWAVRDGMIVASGKVFG